MRWCSMRPDADRNRINHMLEAAIQAVSFVQHRSRGDLDTDAQLRFALLRALEVLGEAASRSALKRAMLIKRYHGALQRARETV